MARIPGDKLAVQSAGVDVENIKSLGTLPGVEITLVGGLNGPGTGVLCYDGSGNLSWKAPESAQHGADVDVSAGGDFTLYDGNDLDKWIEVTVVAASLPGSYQSSAIELAKKYNNPVASIDRDIGAGTVSWSVGLWNDAGEALQNVTAWLAPDLPENRELRIKWTAGGSYVRPFNEVEGQSLFGTHTLSVGVPIVFWIERAVADVANPARRIGIWLSFDDTEGGRARVLLCGRYRVHDSSLAVYEAYQDDADDPVPGVDTPLDTSVTVPWTPSDVFGDALHHLCLVRMNRYGLRGAARRIVQKRISAGEETGLPPNPPAEARIVALPAGYTRVLARYLRPIDGDQKATHWAVWYTTDGSTPGSGDPDHTETIRWTLGRYGILDWRGIAQQADGVVVKVLVKAQTGDLRSATGQSVSYTVERDGPSVPQGGEVQP